MLTILITCSTSPRLHFTHSIFNNKLFSFSNFEFDNYKNKLLNFFIHDFFLDIGFTKKLIGLFLLL